MERAVLLAEGDAVQVDELGLGTAGQTTPPLENMPLDEIERHFIVRALERCDGNVVQAAETLGLSRSAMYRRIEHFDIQSPKEHRR